MPVLIQRTEFSRKPDSSENPERALSVIISAVDGIRARRPPCI